MKKTYPQQYPKLLSRLKKSYKRPEKGDIFVMQRNDNDKYIYGLVVNDKASIGMDPNLLLVYIYKYETPTIEPIPKLHKEDLIIPPDVQGYQGWREGYYLTVGKLDDKQMDTFKQHFFWSARDRKNNESVYYNEFAQKVGRGPIDNLTMFGMGTHYIVDLRLRIALGISPPDALE